MIFFLIGNILLVSYFFNYRRKDPKPISYPSVSVVIPVWNENRTIAETMESIVKMKNSYKGEFEIIIVDNNSTDDGPKIVQQYAKKYNYIKLIYEKDKQGKSFAINKGINAAKNELIVTIDADSFPYKDSLEYIVGYFDDAKTGAVVTKLRVKDPKHIIEKFQNIEYFYSNFYILALDYLESVFVARGPLSVFRRAVLKQIGGFIDAKVTPTEDMEITFRVRKAGYNIRVSKEAFVETKVMPTVKALYKQRMRWNTGTIKTFFLHRDVLFNPVYNFFGLWVGPTVAFSYILLFIVIYYLIRELLNNIDLVQKAVWNITHHIPLDFSWIPFVYHNIGYYIPYYTFFLIFSFSLLIGVYYIAFLESNVSIRSSFMIFMAYVFIYYLFLLSCNLIAIWKLIINKDVPWR